MNDDADLVARVRRGDRQAFDDLYNRYADDVFSMCLLILGDPTVARAAAGTAFALVARTRLNPLSDPTRLRPWLLELARGSALAWSGSPQARSVPVPHGVSPEELLDGAVVPAPASLRAGLARTFDRAAVAAEAAIAAAGRRAAARAQAEEQRIQPADASSGTGDATRLDLMKKPRLVPVPAFPATSAASVAGPVDSVDPVDDAVTVISPSTGQTRVQRGDDRDDRWGDRSDDRSATILPLIPVDSSFDDRGAAGDTQDWRARPAIAVAAALVVAVAGLTAVVSWPTGDAGLVADGGPGIAVIAPSVPPAPQPNVQPPAPASDALSPTMVPTVAGAYTSKPASRQTEQHIREVDTVTDERPSTAPPAPAPSTPPTPPTTTNAPAPPPPTTTPPEPTQTVTQPPPSSDPPPTTTEPPTTTTPPTGQAPPPSTEPPPAEPSGPQEPPSEGPPSNPAPQDPTVPGLELPLEPLSEAPMAV